MTSAVNNIIQFMANVTPSDTATIPVTQDLIVTGSGTISVICAGDPTNTPVSFPVAGAFRFGGLSIKQVRATGTTLTSSQILACYC